MTFSVIEKNGYSIKIQINVSSTNADDARIYYVFRDGEVVNGGTNNIIILNSLKMDTEYNLQCAVIDKQGKIKLSNIQKVRTEKSEILYAGNKLSNIITGFNPFRVDAYPEYTAYSKSSTYYALIGLGANRKSRNKYNRES